VRELFQTVEREESARALMVWIVRKMLASSSRETGFCSAREQVAVELVEILHVTRQELGTISSIASTTCPSIWRTSYASREAPQLDQG